MGLSSQPHVRDRVASKSEQSELVLIWVIYFSRETLVPFGVHMPQSPYEVQSPYEPLRHDLGHLPKSI